MTSPLRLVFLGSDPIAMPLLEWLSGEGRDIATVIAVFTQPDRAMGRGQKVQPNAIKTWALARNIPVLQPEKIMPDVREQLAGSGADLVLVMAYGHILKDDFITTPRLGTLNLHTSLLPKYRGASPIQTAIACGEKETGVSLMRIVRKLDAGPVGDVERVAIEPLDTSTEVEAKLAAACVPLLRRALPKVAEGSLTFVEQDESLVSFCRKLDKSDGVVDFTLPAAVVAARINGLYPWPGCRIDLNRQPVRVGLADVLPDDGDVESEPPAAVGAPGEVSLAPQTPVEDGTVIGVDEQGLLVKTPRGIVRLRKLQRAGGRMLPARDFLRGFPVGLGTRIPSRPVPPLLAEH
jgi:methionyl-tRNA formyltransferase